ncbi:MAG: ankyrin repeat domain-containing protein [Candidatus Paceibacterota bacterium]
MILLLAIPMIRGGPPLAEDGNGQLSTKNVAETSDDREVESSKHAGDVRQRQAVIDAAKSGDIAALKGELRQGHDVNARDETAGMTALMWAAQNADAETVHFLIDSSADVNMRSDNGRTALYMAMSNPKHRVEIVRTLLAKGAKPSMQENPENWWLRIYGRALQTGAEPEIFKLLLNSGLDLNPPEEWSWQPLPKAAAYGRADVVELLLERGAAIDTTPGSEKTVLMRAAGAVHPLRSDPIRTLQLLLDAGADAQIQRADRDGMTALHYAAETAGPLSSAKIDLLLKAGAKVDARNNEGRTSLMLAALNSSDASPVRILLQAGADPNARDHHDFTPLHWAIHWGQRPPNYFAIYRLLEKRADVNRASDAGWTPLMLACRQSDSKILALLLSRGADPNLRNDDGWTALLIALANNKREIWSQWLREEKWFVQPGRPMSEQDANFLAATLIGNGPTYGQVGLVWILLTHGANLDVKAKDGTTVHSLLNGRDDTSAAAVRKLLEIDVRDDVRQHKNGNDREP